MSKSNPYETCDLYLGAFLSSSGHKVTLDWTSKPGRATFQFCGEVGPLVSRYFKRESSVDAETYASHIKMLKSLVHNRGKADAAANQ